MKIAIMQPYFFPYIGYFQLLNAVDKFVIYDNIEYTKKGWINRNRILHKDKDLFISLPLKKGSDYLNINERFLSDNFSVEKNKLLNKIKNSYSKAPQFDNVFSLVKKCLDFEDNNLFNFILNSLKLSMEYLDIDTPLVISSTIDIDHELKAEKKIIEICKINKANNYINPIGGTKLYDKKKFENNNLKLFFIKTGDIRYEQLNNVFVPWLSIIDVMMFNSESEIKKYLNNFTLI